MPNRLAAEKSPYLLQHKDNPVDWYPWGPEAFAKAKAEDKPLLLSIGYSTCHWCHVMERESFVDPKTAAVMNEFFVCVKLDREERPDVDKLYMTAVQAMSGQGGWPLNCFLTPELKPFFGGTYFPPEARWGQPAWTGLLRRVAELWRERRKEIESDAARLAANVSDYVAAEGERGRPGVEALAAALDANKAAYDAPRGGFGGAPKFPLPSNLRLLLRLHARSGDAAAREMAVETLRAMARGGLFDQLGGGFARYSTDAEWRIPHFEKMLYDNAQLISVLADARALTGDAELESALRRTADYLSRDLRHPDGGFYSAEDADSLPPGAPAGAHGEEGAFYLWTDAELDAALGGQAAAFKARYGVVPEGNALADPHGEFHRKCVLYEKDPAALSEKDAAPLRGKLLALRARRPRPARDEKILASWNGLAIGALARAHAVLGEPEFMRQAAGAADFVRAKMTREDGRLWHRWADGQAAVPGFADDYAYMVSGLLDLYEASLDPARLADAVALAQAALRLFALPGGGLAMTAAGDGAELFARPVEDHDGVEPSAGAVMADAALRLFELTGREAFRRFADETLERFGPRLDERPLSMPYLLGALDRAQGPSRLLVIAGLDLTGGPELLAAARAGFRPSLTVAGFTASTRAALAAVVPAVGEMKPAQRAAAYLCTGGACGLPMTEDAALRAALDKQ